MIKMIGWEALDAELAGEAENGINAIKIVAEKKPDIVITDIRMPNCDGVSLLKKISGKYPDIQTIVISGYDDFEYARAALKSGSLDYLLKPVDPGELNRAIKNACTVIKAHKKALPVDTGNKSNLLYRFIHGKGGEETGTELFPPETGQGYYYTAAVFRHYGETGVLQKLEDIIKKFTTFKGILTALDTRELSAVFFDSRDRGKSYFDNKVWYAVQDKLILQNIAQGDAVAGIGKTTETYRDLVYSYNSACEALCHTILNKDTQVFRYHKTSIHPFINIPIENYEHILEAGIISGSPETVKTILRGIYDQYFSQRDISLDSIQLAVSKLCHIVIRLKASISRDIQDFLDKTGNPETLFEFKSIQNIKNSITNFYILSAEWYREDKNVKYSTSKRIKEFIEKNYAADISLSFIARQFHLNPSYLSSLFKQKTGENINEFINHVRINNAKQILRTGDGRIAQIAQLVGFSNDNYFYKVFKRVTGQTPGEFQKSLKNETYKNYSK
jgi:two-component system response regulator YesN